MSVLRPFNAFAKKVNKVKENLSVENPSTVENIFVGNFTDKPLLESNSELVVTAHSTELLSPLEVKSDNIPPEVIVPVIIVPVIDVPKEAAVLPVPEEKTPEEIKEEKISAVLQEILNRKIEKAIINAEASLETSPQVIPATPNADTHTATTGQEILTTSSVQEITYDSSTPLQNVNVIPVHVVTEETISIPEPVVSTQEQGIFSPRPTESIPKVHWFDKLFGSAPKTPPQVV